MKLNRFNPFTAGLWILLFITLTMGFFLGALYESAAYKKNQENTCQYIHKYLRPF